MGLYRNGDLVELYLNETYEGMELLINKELNQEDIKSENLFIAKKGKGETLIAIVGGEKKILSFKSAEGVEVNLVQKISKLELVKKALGITGNEKLLGEIEKVEFKAGETTVLKAYLETETEYLEKWNMGEF